MIFGVRYLTMAVLGAGLAVGLAGGLAACDQYQTAVRASEEPNSSAMYDMAVDAGRSYSDRRSGAMMLQGPEVMKFRAAMMTRIPRGWYTTAGPDTALLATVGDEWNAEFLEGLYAKAPDAREDSGSALVMLHTGVAVIRNRMGTQGLEIAEDRLVNLAQRQLALARLDGAGRVALQGVLLERIPGKRDGNTLNDIALLGLIGDETAAVRLEGIYKVPDFVDVGGDLTAALMGAVQAIRGRLAAG